MKILLREAKQFSCCRLKTDTYNSSNWRIDLKIFKHILYFNKWHEKTKLQPKIFLSLNSASVPNWWSLTDLNNGLAESGAKFEKLANIGLANLQLIGIIVTKKHHSKG